MNASSDIQAHKKWKRSRDEKFPMSLSHAVLRRVHLVKDSAPSRKKSQPQHKSSCFSLRFRERRHMAAQTGGNSSGRDHFGALQAALLRYKTLISPGFSWLRRCRILSIRPTRSRVLWGLAEAAATSAMSEPGRPFCGVVL
jgi:hypothetical protein